METGLNRPICRPHAARRYSGFCTRSDEIVCSSILEFGKRGNMESSAQNINPNLYVFNSLMSANAKLTSEAMAILKGVFPYLTAIDGTLNAPEVRDSISLQWEPTFDLSYKPRLAVIEHKHTK
ncbi:hypothetical protein LXL04_008221 [Taraxacum kok-saghyz]